MRMATYSLYTYVPIVVAAVTSDNYIRHEEQMDWLSEKSDNDKLIVLKVMMKMRKMTC